MHWVLEPSHLAQRQVALPAELCAAGCSAVRWGEGGRVIVGDPAGRIWTLQVVFYAEPARSSRLLLQACMPS